LVYSGVKFEVLNPKELSTKWANVNFVQPYIKENEYLKKLDLVLDYYQPKGLFSAFIDSRPTALLSDIKKIENSELKVKLFAVVDRLYNYHQNLKITCKIVL
jgi:hypothetical protein